MNNKTNSTVKSHKVDESMIYGTTVDSSLNNANVVTGKYIMDENTIIDISQDLLDSSTMTAAEYKRWYKTNMETQSRTATILDLQHVTINDSILSRSDPSSYGPNATAQEGKPTAVDASAAREAFYDLMRAEGKDPSTFMENQYKPVV